MTGLIANQFVEPAVLDCKCAAGLADPPTQRSQPAQRPWWAGCAVVTNQQGDSIIAWGILFGFFGGTFLSLSTR